MDEFHPFTWLHLASALGGIAIIALTCKMGLLSPSAERLTRRVWIWGILVLQTLNIAWFFTRFPLDLSVAMPLHVCDLAGWLALLGLATRNRFWKTMLFYWGIGLSTQAFFTPTVHTGPAHIRFWLFWGTHTQIVGSAIYDLVVLRYRPSWRDYLIAMATTVAYFLFVLPINLHFGWNYGYVGKSVPGAGTIVDGLGAWPLRLLWMFFIIGCLFAVLTIPFALSRRQSEPAAPSR